MQVNGINTAFDTNSPNAASQSNAGDEKNLFMSLLVAQLKNQDPLSPQDSNAFVAQLAQFNSLDQLIGIRQSIERLTSMAEQPPAPAPKESKNLPELI